jgi:hypothetical protein
MEWNTNRTGACSLGMDLMFFKSILGFRGVGSSVASKSFLAANIKMHGFRIWVGPSSIGICDLHQPLLKEASKQKLSASTSSSESTIESA